MIHRRDFVTGPGRLLRPVTTLPGMCVDPRFVADDLMRLEGFTEGDT
jgi:hypothetical protein